MQTMKTVVAFSGGMDSAVLLAQMEIICPRVDYLAVGFHYGSKHNPYEEEARKNFLSVINSRRIMSGLSPIVHRQIDLTAAFATAGVTSNLLRGHGDVPDGHYEEESMRQTVVPGRNLIMLSVLAALAESSGASQVAIGVHAGDHHIYPDCRPAFIQAARSAVLASSDGRVRLEAPFIHNTKADIVKMGLAAGVRFEFTRTCYKDQPVACGVCGSCQERLEAFHLNGKEDPLKYESRTLIPKTVTAFTGRDQQDIQVYDNNEADRQHGSD